MKEAKDRIVFPLDLPTKEEAVRYIDALSGSVGMFKVGLELFIQTGADLIEYIKTSGGAEVFLDLKLHDIPVTVNRAMDRISRMGVKFVTVHCGESRDMLEAAVRGGRGRVNVLGVTVLTSVSEQDILNSGFRKMYARDVSRLVFKRAAQAKQAGCAGIVCSGLEVAGVKKEFGKEFLAVTPGIRPGAEAMDQDDQQRVTTPRQAVQNGSDYLVIGRPIRDAADPRAAALNIAREIERVV